MDILLWLGIGEAQAFALVAGTLACLGVTQAVKKLFDVDDARVLRVLAIVVATPVTYILWADSEFSWPGLIAGFIVGLWTTVGFRAFKVFAQSRGWGWVDQL